MSYRPKFLKPSEGPLYPERVPEREGGALADEDARSSFVYNRYHHLPHAAQRQKLPIFQYRNHILYLLERYQTLVLVGETGCGKSTQVPQYLLEVGHRVCVTEPRVAAAVSLAARVAEERGERVGERVGYAAGMTSERRPDTGLVFVTEGALLREMFASPLLMQYSCVILDEVHERTQLTDVLMGLLKKIIKKRKSLKLVVSSATLDAEFLRDFFNVNEKGRRGSATVLSVHGRPHAVDLLYVEEPVADYVKATVETVIKIHENEPFGDVLAFLTSQEEIRSAQESLESYATSNRAAAAGGRYASGVQWADVSVLPLYGSLPHYQQLRVFQTAGPRVRKVILSTNIAETSVTVPGVSYVVDCGFHKLPYFSPSVGVPSVCVTPVSKNNAVQRAGRAGRTAPGKCYRLYTESAYGALAPSVPPEMCRSDLSAALLQLKALGIHNLLKFSFPTPPPAKCILSGLELLYALQAIDKLGAMTSRGANMAELPLRPMLARILCGSDEWGCIDEALSIVSMLQVDGVFSGAGAAARVGRRNNFEVAEGDIIMYLNIMDAFLRLRTNQDEKRARRESRDWCGRVGLDHRVMEKAYEIRTSLEKLVKHKFGMTDRQFDGPDLGSAKLSRVMKCVCAGLFPQASRLDAAGAYRGVRGATLYMSSDSCLYTTQLPDWVVFASVSSAGERTCMRDVMRVRREWLLELAPHYYTEE